MFKSRSRSRRRFTSSALGQQITAELLEKRTLLSGANDWNDQFGEAIELGQLTTSATNSGALVPVDDVDIYQFDVSAGAEIRFETIATTSVRMRLFGELISSSRPPQELVTSTDDFTWRFADAGTYYVGVSHSSNAFYNGVTGGGDRVSPTAQTGSYQITLTNQDPDDGGAANDDWNDQFSEAMLLGQVTTEVTFTAALTPVEDVDMFQFEVQAGAEIRFETDATTSLRMRLFGELISSAHPPQELRTSTETFTYRFADAGTYFLGVSHSSNAFYSGVTGGGDFVSPTAQTGSYELRLTNESSGDGDSDDELTEADNIGLVPIGATELTGRIDTNTDVDMIRFDVRAGQRVRFDIDATAGLDSFLRLFNRNGKAIRQNNNAAGPGEKRRRDSYLERDFNRDGTFYISVSSQGNQRYSPGDGDTDRTGRTTGDYTLLVTAVDSTDSSSQDQEDQISEATHLPRIDSRVRRFKGTSESRDSVDMFSFDGVAGERVQFWTGNNRAAERWHLRIFSADGTELVAASRAVDLRIESTGTYYIGLSSRGNQDYDALTGEGDERGQHVASYTLNYSATPDDADDQIAEAAPLTPLSSTWQTQEGSIEWRDDVDMYSFEVASGERARFTTGTTNSSQAWHLRLFNGDGTVIDGGRQAVDHVFETGGTYYVGVSSHPNTTYDALTGDGDRDGEHIGSYTLSFTAQPEDNDDQISEAVALGRLSESPQSRGGAIEWRDDVDMYSFQVGEDERVRFSTGNTHSAESWRLRMFNQDGDVLVTGTRAIDHVFAEGGLYYLGLSANPNSVYNPLTGEGDRDGQRVGSYTLTHVAQPDDADDQISEAENLGRLTTTDVQVRRGTSTRDDVDMFAFDVDAGDAARFTFGNVRSAEYWHLRIFDSAGNELAGANRSLIHTFSAGGTYFVGVSTRGNFDYDALTGLGDEDGQRTGPYTLTAGLIEHG